MAAAPNYQTWTLSAGSGTQSIPDEYWTGNRLENLLIDQSASNAGVKHVLDGNAVIQNVGITGRADVGGNNYQFGLVGGGDIIFNNVFLDGSANGTDYMGVYAATSYSGSCTIRGMFIQHYADNALYLDDAAKGGNGTFTIENCYARNNNIASYRVGTSGSVVRNCRSVVDGEVPAHANGGENARAIFTVYENQSIDVIGCHFAHAGHNAIIGQGATVNVSDTQYQGNVSGRVNLQGGNGNQPQTTVQSGVPTSPEMAAGGTASSGGVAPPGGGGGGGGGGVGGGGGGVSFVTRDIGFDDLPETLAPPAPTITVDAIVDHETFRALNALRDRDDPMEVAIGHFTMANVGITDLRVTETADSGLDVAITLQEYRTRFVASSQQSEQTDGEEAGGQAPSDFFVDDSEFGAVPGADTTTTVNLADEGLQTGDVIDGYLADHFQSGTRVEIPYGTYTWNGGGVSGEYQDAVLAGVPADTGGTTTATTASQDATAEATPSRAVFESSGDVSPPRLTVTGGGAGSVHLDSVSFTGQRTGAAGLIIAVTAADASALLNKVFLPDGSGGGQTVGVLVPDTHVGGLYLRNCHVRGFANCGVLAGTAPGVVRVEGGLYRNNNVADLQFGGDDSRAELVTIVNDQQAPAFDGTHNQRGVWFRGSGSGMQVVECDLYHNVGSGSPIVATSGGAMSGTVKNTRITNDSQRPAAIIRNDITFEGVHVTGSGNTTLKGVQAACVGDGCDPADWSTSPESEQTAEDAVTLAAGEVKTVEVGDNETLAGKVYDQSAEGARVEIVATGQSWTVENIAIVGQPGGDRTRAAIQPRVASGSTATIRNVWLADGAPAATGATGIRVADAHAGALTIQDCNIQRFPDIGIHAHRPGASGGGGGAVTVDNCYLAHNGRANVTLGVNGSDLVNSVVYGDGTGPVSGAGGYRGVWGWYQDVAVTNTDVFMGTDVGPAVVGGRHGGTVQMTNGNLSGGTDGSVTTANVGGTPATALPTGVPDSPVQAAGQN